MPFSESLKSKVRRQAGYRCCMCQQIASLEIHHIVPQSEGGPDDWDNAAPLCPSCHDTYDGNRRKRKEIRDRRDALYRSVEQQLDDLVAGVFAAAQSVCGFAEYWRRGPDRSDDEEVHVVAGPFPGEQGKIAFSVQGWPDGVSQEEINGIVSRISPLFASPMTIFGSVVIVTRDGVRKTSDQDGELIPLHYGVRHIIVSGIGRSVPIDFVSMWSLSSYLRTRRQTAEMRLQQRRGHSGTPQDP